MIIIF